MSNFQEQFYAECKFGGFTDIDGTIAFYSRVNSLLNNTHVVLDFGCGIGVYGTDKVPYRRALRILKDKVKKVVGVDIDPSAQKNPFIDEFHILTSEQIPVLSSSVDICICDQVLEHLPNPILSLTEFRRVLKPNGTLCIRTTNCLSYIGILSALIPNRLHQAVLKMAQPSREEADIFPVHYRCNSVWALKKALSYLEFDSVVYGYEAEPSYLAFSKLVYAFGVIRQRLAPKIFRPSISAFATPSEKRIDLK